MVNLRLSIVKIRFCYRVGLLSPGLGAVSKNAVVWGDRGFESISLQRGVQCEPGVSATGSKCGDNSSLEGPRVRIRLPPARSLFTEKALYPAAELDRLCLDHIARFKRPRDYRFVEALPKNNYGKVLKTELRRLLTDNPEEGRPTR
jgi:acyl-CoA synthetase (AMP-forming)/AMP-acid ligase II